MYCLHHEEAELYGSETVPCPFCGLEADATRSGSDETEISLGPLQSIGFEDSNQALQHAFTLAEDDEPRHRPRRGTGQRAFW